MNFILIALVVLGGIALVAAVILKLFSTVIASNLHSFKHLPQPIQAALQAS